jgi:hypothetical protein
MSGDAGVAGVLGSLVAGSNPLEFIVHNTGNNVTDFGGGPTGLDAQVSLSFMQGSPVPEPSTTVPLALVGLAGGFAIRRRQRRCLTHLKRIRHRTANHSIGTQIFPLRRASG